MLNLKRINSIDNSIKQNLIDTGYNEMIINLLINRGYDEELITALLSTG